jgi:hypothetical protein
MFGHVFQSLFTYRIVGKYNPEVDSRFVARVFTKVLPEADHFRTELLLRPFHVFRDFFQV